MIWQNIETLKIIRIQESRKLYAFRKMHVQTKVSVIEHIETAKKQRDEFPLAQFSENNVGHNTGSSASASLVEPRDVDKANAAKGQDPDELNNEETIFNDPFSDL